MTRAAALLLLLALASCTRPEPAPDAWCALGPVTPTNADADVISDQLVEQLITINEFGRLQCGWRKGE